MLSSVHDRIPELYPYYYSAYSQASCLFFGQYIILSGQGPQQGDPIGPLLFSNTLHPTLSSLKASLNLGYLDDITLGDTQTVVAADVKEVTEKGLSLNVDKCELITHKDTQMDDDILRSFNRVELEEATLLGAPLLSGSVLDSTRDDRCADLARACDRLSSPSAQDALILLRSSFSAPRVMHLLRCSPSTNHPALSKFDDILKVSIQRITNCDFSDLQWIQASLPVRDGGLGIRRVASLALLAFLASAASTLSLQADILSSCTPSDNNFSSLVCCHGHISLETSLRSSIPSNLSGTVLACWQRRLWWNRHSTRHMAGPRSWLLVQNIAVTGYLPFHLPRMGFI